MAFPETFQKHQNFQIFRNFTRRSFLTDGQNSGKLLTDIFSAKKPAKSAKKPVTGHSKVMKYANYIKTDSKGGLVIDINAGMWFNYRLSQFLISKWRLLTLKFHSNCYFDIPKK